MGKAPSESTLSLIEQLTATVDALNERMDRLDKMWEAHERQLENLDHRIGELESVADCRLVDIESLRVRIDAAWAELELLRQQMARKR